MSHPRRNPASDTDRPYDSLLGDMAQPSNKPLFYSEAQRIAAEFQPGHVIDEQYKIRTCLGQGGMGMVFLARDQLFDKEVAVKIILPQFVDADNARQRFFNEMRVLRDIAHENIVRAYSGHIERKTGMPYIVMEYVRGKTLAEYVADNGGRLPLEEAVEIMSQICSALGAAHPNLVHRDLKPQNILRQDDGTIKVLDFGLAKALDQDGYTKTMMGLGTPRYLSPEQANDAKRVDHRTDIYALGVMLYEFLTGAMAVGQFDPPSRVVPGLPKHVDKVIGRALARYDDRYDSAAAFMNDLHDAVRPRRSGRLVAAGVAAALVVGAVTAVAMTRDSVDTPAIPETPAAEVAGAVSENAKVSSESINDDGVEISESDAVEPPSQENVTANEPVAPVREDVKPNSVDEPVTREMEDAEASPRLPVEETEPAEPSKSETIEPTAAEPEPTETEPIASPTDPETIDATPAEPEAIEIAARPQPSEPEPMVRPAAEPTRPEPEPAVERASPPVQEKTEEPDSEPGSFKVASSGATGLALRPDLNLHSSYVEGSLLTLSVTRGPTNAEYEWLVNGRTVARGMNRQTMQVTLDRLGELNIEVLLRHRGQIIARSSGRSVVESAPRLPWRVPVAVECTIDNALPTGYREYEWMLDGRRVSNERVFRHTFAEPGRYRLDGYARDPVSSSVAKTYVHQAYDTVVEEWRSEAQ